ncbi:MAG: C69 family dipeptidase [Synergistaceae bacterium]|nr:C69 family dipeptidase [Synergistaceae bacterium]
MIKNLFIVCLLILCLVCLPQISFACTTIIVGKEASTDGSHFIGRTSDAPTFSISRLQHIPAYHSDKPIIYRDDMVNFEITLPSNELECFAVPSNDAIHENNTSEAALRDLWWESAVNEKHVGISATETINSNDKVKANDPFVKSGLREGNIPRLVIPYISSAKEGVLRLAKLVEEYGMMSAEAVIFIDEKEIWYMEMYTGHRYAAQKLPEDCCACIPNDAMLGFYDKNDKENWIASDDIVEFAKKAGTYQELDGKFHLALSYGTPKRDYSQLRVWAGRRHFTPSVAGKYDVKRQYEIFFKPEKKISILDAFELTRDRHEGTPQATDKPGNNTRPIGIDRTEQAHFIQFRKDCSSPILWVSLAAPEFSVYFPIFGLPNELDKNFTYYSLDYNSNAFAWKLFEIADLATHDRERYSRLVRDKFSTLEKKFVVSLDLLEKKYNSQGANAVLVDVTQETVKTVDEVKAKILLEFTKKRIEDTKNLGKDQVK